MNDGKGDRGLDGNGLQGEGGGVFSVNNGQSLKYFRKETNLIRWVFEQKDNSRQHFRSKFKVTRRPAVRLS